MLEGCLYLRNYPAKFGDAIVRLREDLVGSRIHHSYPEPVPPGVDTVNATPLDQGLFSTANLMEVVKYLRYGKNLKLPDYWKAIIPKPWNYSGVISCFEEFDLQSQ